MITIIRSYVMYRPLRFFSTLGIIPLAVGIIIGFRFLWLMLLEEQVGHVQSLVLASILIIIGVFHIILGIQADIIAKNRKILEDIQYHVKRIEYDGKQ